MVRNFCCSSSCAAGYFINELCAIFLQSVYHLLEIIYFLDTWIQGAESDRTKAGRSSQQVGHCEGERVLVE